MRGVVYSLMAVMLAIPALLFMAMYAEHSWGQGFSVDAVIADQIHQIQGSIERDFERAALISGRRALMAMSERVITTGEPLSDPSSFFRELVMNGTLEGNQSIVMAGNTITDWIQAVTAVESRFHVSVEADGVSVSNKDGFNLLMRSRLELHVSDPDNTSRHDVNVIKNMTLSVENLEDPLFPLKTNGAVKRIIQRYSSQYHAMSKQGTFHSGNCSGTITTDKDSASKSGKILAVESSSDVVPGFAGVLLGESVNLSLPQYSIGCFVSGVPVASFTENATAFIDEPSGKAWVLPLKESIEDKAYYEGSGPNFLQRLQGITSPSPDGMGIETFITPGEETINRPQQDRLAYLYLSNQTHAACTRVRWMQDWFRTGNSTAIRYGIGGLSYEVC
ncbi:MAG: hypothetical protein DRO99_01155 [Candidatus Aenigmatarchaeota archaeon]|nr:MAG: hypothetical protein DRO99_01155 [Candidatus Aenigmarchaeota archaeon]